MDELNFLTGTVRLDMVPRMPLVLNFLFLFAAAFLLSLGSVANAQQAPVVLPTELHKIKNCARVIANLDAFS